MTCWHEDLDKTREASRDCGFIFESLPMEFSASGITSYRFTNLIDSVPLMLGALIADGPLAAVCQSRLAVTFESGTIHVVSKTGLVTMRLAAGRPQDIADVKRLAELDRG